MTNIMLFILLWMIILFSMILIRKGLDKVLAAYFTKETFSVYGVWQKVRSSIFSIDQSMSCPVLLVLLSIGLLALIMVLAMLLRVCSSEFQPEDMNRAENAY